MDLHDSAIDRKLQKLEALTHKPAGCGFFALRDVPEDLPLIVELSPELTRETLARVPKVAAENGN